MEYGKACLNCGNWPMVDRVCCRDCGEMLNGENRVQKSVSKKGKQYYLNRCKSCISESDTILRRLKKEHPKPQSGTPCACCGRIAVLHCDHDHGPEKFFRGWICQLCNSSIGMLGDSEDGLRKALAYLERARPKSRSRSRSDNKTPHDNSQQGHSRDSAQSVEMASIRGDDEQQGTENMRANE